MVTNITQPHSSVVIDDIYSQLNNDPNNTGIACLYADYKDQSNQTLVHILGTFLRQFLNTAEEPILDEVIQRLHDIRNKGRKVETEDILALLKLQLHYKRMFICIDAIDELDPKVLQQLLNVLKGLDANNTRLFFTGRNHIASEVQKYFQVAEKNKVTICASQQDIQEFVGKQIIDDLNPDAMDKVLAKDIVDAIVQKSQGM